MEDQHPVVGQQYRRNARDDGGSDIGYRLVGPTRPVACHWHPG
jgi:hypothetical protein